MISCATCTILKVAPNYVQNLELTVWLTEIGWLTEYFLKNVMISVFSVQCVEDLVKTDFNIVHSIPQHGWMSLLNLATLGYPGQRN